MNPLPLIVKLLTNKNFWILIFVIWIGASIYESSKIPEHCIKNTKENRLTLSAFQVSISSADTNKSEICFQTRDSNLIAQINQKVQHAELERTRLELQAKKEFWEKYFYPILIAGVVIVLGAIWIHSRRENYW